MRSATNPQSESRRMRDSLFLSLAIGHYARKMGYFRDPATINFLLCFEVEIEVICANVGHLPTS